MKHYALLSLALILPMLAVTSCNDREQKSDMPELAIDSVLQDSVSMYLSEKMNDINAYYGLAAVMELESGKIIAMEEAHRNDTLGNTCHDNLAYADTKRLSTLSTIMCCLDRGMPLEETFDVSGAELPFAGDTIYDHNWDRGGYGVLSVADVFAQSSDCGIAKMVNKYYAGDFQTYRNDMAAKGYHISEDATDADFIRGYGLKMDAIELLSLYSEMSKDSVARNLLAFNLSNGLGKKAQSDNGDVAGKETSVLLEDENHVLPCINGEHDKDRFQVGFCGFFPKDEPQYAAIVLMRKQGKPVSGGGMAGPVFAKIANLLESQAR